MSRRSRLEMDEGDALILPCSSCASVTLLVRVVAGRQRVECRKCLRTSIVAMESGAEGWSLSTHVLPAPLLGRP